MIRSKFYSADINGTLVCLEYIIDPGKYFLNYYFFLQLIKNVKT